MSFNLNDVRQSSTIGKDLYGPSLVLAHDIDVSSKHRVDTINKQVRTRDVIMKGLPVLTEAQLRAGEAIAPIDAMEKEVGQTLGGSMESKRNLAAKKKTLGNGLMSNESEPVRLMQSNTEEKGNTKNGKDTSQTVQYGPKTKT